MNIPCKHNTPCIDEASALGNYSAEDPDQLLFRGVYWKNQIWDNSFDIWEACYGLCESTVSQAEADLCAHNNAMICERDKLFGNVERTYYKTCCDGNQYSVIVPADTFTGFSQGDANAEATDWANDYLTQLCESIFCPGTNPNPGPPPVFRFPPPDLARTCNDEQQLEVPCFDGGKGVTIAACTVWGSNKDAANEKAQSYGESLLTNNIGCLIEFLRSTCVGDIIDQSVVPDRISGFTPPFTWEVFGAVPAGISFTPNGPSMRIHGTFASAGDWGFRLTMTDTNGTYTYRVYQVSVMEITEPTVLPTGQQDESYSHAIDVEYGVLPRTFAIETGSSLPDGLTLNGSTGVISGTPTGYGNYEFTIVVGDSEDAVCKKRFTLVIDPNIFAAIPWNTSSVPTANGSGYTTASGENAVLFSSVPSTVIPSANENRAWFTFNAFNPTAANLTGSLVINQQRVNGAPPNPSGVQWQFYGGYSLSRTAPAPLVIANSLGPVSEGTYGPFIFTIPPGWSTFVGDFSGAVASSGGAPPPPYPAGSGTMTVTFNLI